MLYFNQSAHLIVADSDSCLKYFWWPLAKTNSLTKDRSCLCCCHISIIMCRLINNILKDFSQTDFLVDKQVKWASFTCLYYPHYNDICILYTVLLYELRPEQQLKDLCSALSQSVEDLRQKGHLHHYISHVSRLHLDTFNYNLRTYDASLPVSVENTHVY